MLYVTDRNKAKGIGADPFLRLYFKHVIHLSTHQGRAAQWPHGFYYFILFYFIITLLKYGKATYVTYNPTLLLSPLTILRQVLYPFYFCNFVCNLNVYLHFEVRK